MPKEYYLKMTGGDRLSNEWFRIKNFVALKDKDTGKRLFELTLNTPQGDKVLMVSSTNPLSVEFKNELNRPVSFIEVIKYFKDTSIGLLVS